MIGKVKFVADWLNPSVCICVALSRMKLSPPELAEFPRIDPPLTVEPVFSHNSIVKGEEPGDIPGDIVR